MREEESMHFFVVAIWEKRIKFIQVEDILHQVQCLFFASINFHYSLPVVGKNRTPTYWQVVAFEATAAVDGGVVEVVVVVSE